MTRAPSPKLASFFKKNTLEAGCDEAGRGCYAGPVVAAAVILPSHFQHIDLKDSKQLSEKKRNLMEGLIKEKAIAYAIAVKSVACIDKINILQAAIKGMNDAIAELTIKPEFLLIDGPYFKNDVEIPHECFVKGDAKFTSIAAASILAKTHRDRLMTALHQKYPMYEWASNKGYGSKAHIAALKKFGPSPHHRKKWLEKRFSQQATFDFMK